MRIISSYSIYETVCKTCYMQ